MRASAQANKTMESLAVFDTCFFRKVMVLPNIYSLISGCPLALVIFAMERWKVAVPLISEWVE